MQWEPTQIMEFEFEKDDLKDKEVSRSETGNPAGYLLQISKLQHVLQTHVVPRVSSKYVVGRSPICDIVIDEPSVSYKHASFEFDDGTLWVTDEGSTNRTSIGNEMPTAIIHNKFCEQGRAYQVFSKQFVTFGDVHYRWYKYSDYQSFIIEEMGDNTQHNLELTPLKARKSSQGKKTSPNVSEETDTLSTFNSLLAGDSGAARLVDTSTITKRYATTSKSEHEGFPVFDPQDDSTEIVLSDDGALAIGNSKDFERRVPPTQMYNPYYEKGNTVHKKSGAFEETQVLDSSQWQNNKMTATQIFDPAHLPLSGSIKGKRYRTSQGSSKTPEALKSQRSENSKSTANVLPKDSLPDILETQPWDFDFTECPETQAFEPSVANAQGVEVVDNVNKKNRNAKKRIEALMKEGRTISKKRTGKKNEASWKGQKLSRNSINKQLKIIKETQIKREQKRYYSPVKATSRKKRRVAKAIKSQMKKKKPCIVQTGSVNPTLENLLKKMGATILQNIGTKVSHVCMDEFRITGKFLCGLAYCDYIVSNRWLARCAELGTFEVAEAKFRVKVNKEMARVQKNLDFRMSQFFKIRNRRRKQIFNGLKLYATKNVDSDYSKAFILHGGQLSKTPGQKFKPSLIVVGVDNSDKEAQELISKKLKVRNLDWVNAAVLSQKIPTANQFRIKRIKRKIKK